MFQVKKGANHGEVQMDVQNSIRHATMIGVGVSLEISATGKIRTAEVRMGKEKRNSGRKGKN